MAATPDENDRLKQQGSLPSPLAETRTLPRTETPQQKARREETEKALADLDALLSQIEATGLDERKSLLTVLLRDGERLDLLARVCTRQPDEVYRRLKAAGQMGKGMSGPARDIMGVLKDKVKHLSPRGSKREMPPERLNDLVEDYRDCIGVERVVIYEGVPASYVFTIEGKALELHKETLFSARAFALAFFDVLGGRRLRVPRDEAVWEEMLDRWMAEAEKIDRPMPGSLADQYDEIIEDFIEKVGYAEKEEEIRTGAILVKNGYQWLSSKALRDRVEGSIRNFDLKLFRASLKRQGWSIHRLWDGHNSTPLRAWRRPLPSQKSTKTEETA